MLKYAMTELDAQCTIVNDRKTAMDASYRQFAKTPSATNWNELSDAMLAYQHEKGKLSDMRDHNRQIDRAKS